MSAVPLRCIHIHPTSIYAILPILSPSHYILIRRSDEPNACTPLSGACAFTQSAGMNVDRCSRGLRAVPTWSGARRWAACS